MIFNITSDDTLTLAGNVFNDFADGDNFALVFGSDTVNAATGKNDNTIFARDAKGDNATATLRLMRGSSDDQFLQTLQAAADQDFVAQTLLSGEFVKRLGDGQGNVARDVYTFSGGMIKRRVDAKENVNGNTDQAIVVFTVFFAQAVRSIQ